MTKRDVAVWFCRVIALVGMINVVLNLAASIGTYLAFRAWGTAVFSVPALALYLFIYLFAGGIGTELAAEGEYGPPLTSSIELGPLLIRCVGFGLLLSSSLSLISTALSLGNFYFITSVPIALPSLVTRFTYQAAAQLFASAIGFVLAFGPRIHAAMQPK